MPHRYNEPEQNIPDRDADRQGKLGWGSLSLPLVVLALVWSFRIGGVCLGDAVLGGAVSARLVGRRHPLYGVLRLSVSGAGLSCWASGSAGSCLPAPAAGLPAFCWRRSRYCMC